MRLLNTDFTILVYFIVFGIHWLKKSSWFALDPYTMTWIEHVLK